MQEDVSTSSSWKWMNMMAIHKSVAMHPQQIISFNEDEWGAPVESESFCAHIM